MVIDIREAAPIYFMALEFYDMARRGQAVHLGDRVGGSSFNGGNYNDWALDLISCATANEHVKLYRIHKTEHVPKSLESLYEKFWLCASKKVDHEDKNLIYWGRRLSHDFY